MARPAIVIRPATFADAELGAELLRRSIAQLCFADHRGDPATIEQWLANKTPEQFRRWVAQDTSLVVVAEIDVVEALAGVAMIDAEGEILLCYVHPDHVRRGVGVAMLAALEAQARAWGLDQVRLSASVTALKFYAAMGYREGGEAKLGFAATTCHPLVKDLK